MRSASTATTTNAAPAMISPTPMADGEGRACLLIPTFLLPVTGLLVRTPGLFETVLGVALVRARPRRDAVEEHIRVRVLCADKAACRLAFALVIRVLAVVEAAHPALEDAGQRRQRQVRRGHCRRGLRRRGRRLGWCGAGCHRGHRRPKDAAARHEAAEDSQEKDNQNTEHDQPADDKERLAAASRFPRHRRRRWHRYGARHPRGRRGRLVQPALPGERLPRYTRALPCSRNRRRIIVEGLVIVRIAGRRSRLRFLPLSLPANTPDAVFGCVALVIVVEFKSGHIVFPRG